ncbi:MAG TPA: queuosine salvage family protein [Acidimicrobiales bacterium]|nr:queuosine salvage family protein [Acidimicrobiales bacterium]
MLEEIRGACARVAGRSRHVQVVPEAVPALAAVLADDGLGTDPEDPAHRAVGDTDEDRARFVLAVDAVNFGSGWFPVLRKAPGASGYHTIAGALRERGGVTVDEMTAATGPWCADLFGQAGNDDVSDLMEHFARSWNRLGEVVARFGGAVPLVEAAGQSADRLVDLLAWEHKMYRDVGEHDGERVPLFKRAQITAADLALAFGGEGPGRFDDLDRLTMFPDNLVPHVLRLAGVLRYDEALLARIEAGELLEPGSEEEVEIRAVAVHAVELLVAALQELGVPATAGQVDMALWHRGGRPESKAVPRHRCRTTAY